jgi:hypothetical protein
MLVGLPRPGCAPGTLPRGRALCWFGSSDYRYDIDDGPASVGKRLEGKRLQVVRGPRAIGGFGRLPPSMLF